MCRYRESFKRCQECRRTRFYKRETWDCDLVRQRGSCTGDCPSGVQVCGQDQVQTTWEERCGWCKVRLSGLLIRLGI